MLSRRRALAGLPAAVPVRHRVPNRLTTRDWSAADLSFLARGARSGAAPALPCRTQINVVADHVPASDEQELSRGQLPTSAKPCGCGSQRGREPHRRRERRPAARAQSGEARAATRYALAQRRPRRQAPVPPDSTTEQSSAPATRRCRSSPNERPTDRTRRDCSAREAAAI